MKKIDAKAIKVRRYKNRMKSADKAPYLMRVVSNGEVHLDDILQEVAKETGWTVPTVRMYYNAFFELLQKELQKGNMMKTAIGTFEPAISGSFPNVDSPFAPKKDKVYVKVTPPESWQKALAKLTPVMVGGPESELSITCVWRLSRFIAKSHRSSRAI